MELKEFVKSTLSQIIDAVEELNVQYADKDAIINPVTPYKQEKNLRDVETNKGRRQISEIEFDLTVSVDESKDAEGKVNVLSAIIGGGVSGSRSEGNSTVSRVRFTVPVMLPTRKAQDATHHISVRNQYILLASSATLLSVPLQAFKANLRQNKRNLSSRFSRR